MRRRNRSGGGGGGGGSSVYRRARLLPSAVLPWLLLLGGALPPPHPSSAASPVAAPSVLPGASASRRLRGNKQSRNNNGKRRRARKTVQNYCGADWTDANSSCLRPCPDGTSVTCGPGEQCFADLTSCPSMTLLTAEESGLPPPQPASLAGGFTAGGGGDHGGGDGEYGNVMDRRSPTWSHSAAPYGSLPFQSGAAVPSSCPSTTTNTVNVGYYQSWAKYRSSHCHPQMASSIDVASFGYTHLIYSFAGISASGELEPYNGIADEVTLYREFNALKGSNPGLATLIAVGGWNLDQSLFVRAASSPSSRQTFALSVVRFIQEFDFDGLDLDWEYPVTRQGTPADYDNYPLLVKAIREALDAAGEQNGRQYLLTMAIPVNPQKLDDGFNLKEMSKYLDWFHLMSYDIHGSWDDVAGSNTDMEYISDAVENNILARGVGPDQLVFGMAAYGRSMTLSSTNTCKRSGCPIEGAGVKGCSGEAGFSPYFELKEQYVDTGRYESLLLNEGTMSMEMVIEGGIFVSLDVEDTFSMKRDYYLSKCFRGQMWWAIDMIKTPPFGGGGGAQVSQASSFISDPAPSPTPPAYVQAAEPAISLNTAPGVTQDDSYCSNLSGSGLAPVEDCLGFVHCSNGRMSGSVTMCSPGLIFDANMGICNWPSETNLCGFEFCPNQMTGYVPFEDCEKFYYCKAGRIDGDIDVCSEGTLFDVGLGLCNWASQVVCETMAPTPRPTNRVVAAPEPAVVHEASLPAATPRPTYGTVGATAASVLDTPRPTYGSVAGAFAASESLPSQGVAGWNNGGASSSKTNFQDDTARLHFAPTDDAYVQESMPYENYNDQFVVVDENQRFDGLLRFYVQGLEGRSVRYARLRLYVSNQSSFGGNFFESRHDWHEDVVTWDTVPSIIGSQPLAVLNAAPMHQWVEVDVTGLVDSDGPVSLRITSDSSDNVMYSSKENSDGNAPELIVGVEPASSVNGASLGDNESRDSGPTVTNTFRIGPTDDAFVFRSSSSKNYGRHADLKVDTDNGYKTAYLRFDLSNVNIGMVRGARLRLYATDSSPSGGMFVVSTNSNWSEDEITYENAPTPDGLNLGLIEHVSADEWYELDIIDAVRESGPLTICIIPNHDDRVMYSSKEGPHSPEIALTLEEYVPLSTPLGRVVQLEATDDATIVLTDPDSNFGEGDLRADARDGGMHGFLLRFDASEVPRGEVRSAILRLFAVNRDPAFGGTFVETRRAGWDEGTVTWNTAPDADGRVMGSIAEAEHGSWYDLDVTSAVVGGSPVSFRASSPHFNEAVYASRESGYGPRLVVQYSPPDPVPEGYDVHVPIADGSVLMERPNENFGRNEELKVDGHGGVYNSLLMFDLASVEKGTVEEAVLRLYAVDGSPSGGTFIVTASTDWSRHRVTWNTAPAADGVILGTLGEVVPYRWYEVDLAEIVDDLGGERLSIRVAPSHGLRCAYSSSRDRLGHLPQLLIKADMFKGMG